MTTPPSVETTNLDGYGNPPIPWEYAQSLLDEEHGMDIPYFLGTVDAKGKPHAAGIGVLWVDGGFWLVSGPDTRKSRNLAVNPACTICTRIKGMDLILEGEATRVTDRSTLEEVARLYRDKGGWPAEVDEQGEGFTAPFNAPAAGPPPWYVYRIRIHTAYGTGAGGEHEGASRWRFP